MLFKQTFMMLWQNKYFAFLSLFGITITVAVIMAFFIVLENKTGNIAPEVHADRMMVLRQYTVKTKKPNGSVSTSGSSEIPREIAENALSHLNSAEKTTFFFKQSAVNILINGLDELITVVHTDKNYWEVFRFRFLSGTVFTDEDFNLSSPIALISRELAGKLFFGEDPVGKTLNTGLGDYRVIGVVDDVPRTCKNTYAHVWTPRFDATRPQDHCGVAILMKKRATSRDVQKEVNEVCERYNFSIENADETKNLELKFVTRFEHVISDQNDIFSPAHSSVPIFPSANMWSSPFKAFAFRWFGLLGAFLLIVVINQAGVNLTHLRERSVEMGIRKTFGAGRKDLMIQLFAENIMVCLSGGMAGTVLAWWTVHIFNTQLLDSATVFFPVGLIWIVLSIILFIAVFTSVIPMYQLFRSSIIGNLKEEIQ